MVDVKKISLCGVRLLWFVAMAFLILLALVFGVEIMTSSSFEYYGNSHWPWFYKNANTFVRYEVMSIIILSLCIGYSYRYSKRNVVIALLIGLIPLAFLWASIRIF